MSSPLVSIVDVSRTVTTHGAEMVLLAPVSLDLHAGTLVAISGPSGSGKTTLCNIIVGWERSDTGSVRWADDAAERWARLAVAPQRLALLPSLNVGENLALPFWSSGFDPPGPDLDALARSLEDGPARWYLEQNCASRHYAVCEVFGNNFTMGANEFLWGEHGLRYRASPEQMDRIRAEESEIVLLAAAAYPYAQAARTLKNIGRQLLHFGLTGTRFNQLFLFDAEGKPYLEPLPDVRGWVLRVVEVLSFLSTFICIGWMFWNFQRLRDDARTLLLLVTAGILGNAVTCAVFSGVAHRYQARVIWVLPVVCIALMLGRRNVPSIAGAAATAAVTEPAAPGWPARTTAITRQRPL
jgi:ABC-type sugar transport system ATPase subunit